MVGGQVNPVIIVIIDNNNNNNDNNNNNNNNFFFLKFLFNTHKKRPMYSASLENN